MTLDPTLLRESMELMADGTRASMRRLLADGYDGHISSMDRWTGRYKRSPQYVGHDVGWLLARIWTLYAHTQDEEFRDFALQILRPIIPKLTEEPVRGLGSGVDTYYGLCLGAELTGSDELRSTAVAASKNIVKSLWDEESSRFIPFAGIDNEVPLEFGGTLNHLLWTSSEVPEHVEYYLRHHQALLDFGLVRPDGSTIHLVLLDEDGKFKEYATGQGLAADSTWARGESWAMYSFITAGQWSDNPVMQETADRICEWWVEHLPRDWVPTYDFDDPQLRPPRDSCAAAMGASALMRVNSDKLDPGRLANIVESTIDELCRNYLTDGGLLLHGSMGNMRGHLYGRPISYDPPNPKNAEAVSRTRFPQEDILAYGNYFLVELIHRFLSGELAAYPPGITPSAKS